MSRMGVRMAKGRGTMRKRGLKDGGRVKEMLKLRGSETHSATSPGTVNPRERSLWSSLGDDGLWSFLQTEVHDSFTSRRENASFIEKQRITEIFKDFRA